MSLLNPRARFLAREDYAKQWTNIASSDVCAEAVSTAMLIMATGLEDARNMETAASNNLKLQGARMFMVQLLSLTDTTPDKVKPSTPQNLDHKA